MGFRVCLNKWQQVSLGAEVVGAAYWLVYHWLGKPRE